MTDNTPITDSDENEEASGSGISNGKYDALKHTVQLVLPAIGTLYFALSGIWGFPYPEKVVGSLAAVTVFFGVIVTVLNKSWTNDPSNFDGAMDVLENLETGKKTYSLGLNSGPEDLEKKATVTFKVNKKKQH